MSGAIQVSGLTKRFGAFTAVDAIDLSVRAGELFGLLGPNGAGKTTLVRMLTGLVSITEGEASVGGVDVKRRPDAVRRVLGVVPQALTSDLELSAYENMDIYARYFSVRQPRRRERIERLLTRVGLWERRKSLVKTFSGGMRRRLEIARGLIHRPEVLFLDEPTIGLDPQSRRVIWDLLRELRGEGGLTVSLTTHYLDEADALCERVAIVDAGKVVALGTPSELKAMVPGSDAIDVATERPVPDAVIRRIEDFEGVRAVECGSDTVKIRANGGPALLPRVIETFERASVGVLSASISHVTLEDVFLHFTGHSLRDETTRQAPGPPRRFT